MRFDLTRLWPRRRPFGSSRHFHLLPAQTGTCLLHVLPGSRAPAVVRKTVIGWAMRGDDLLGPVTLDGISDDYTAVLHADGSVDDSLCLHESYDSWLKSMKMEAKEIRARRGSTLQ